MILHSFLLRCREADQSSQLPQLTTTTLTCVKFKVKFDLPKVEDCKLTTISYDSDCEYLDDA